MTITSKSTKAEILAAYNELLAQVESKTITSEQVALTAKTVAKEARLFVLDLYALASFCRNVFAKLVDTYSKPVLVKGVTVNN